MLPHRCALLAFLTALGIQMGASRADAGSDADVFALIDTLKPIAEAIVIDGHGSDWRRPALGLANPKPVPRLPAEGERRAPSRHKGWGGAGRQESKMAENNENVPVRPSVWDLDPFRDFFRSPLRTRRGPWGDTGERSWAPAMDIAESDNSYAVTVELPGASKDDVSVECHDNVLTVKGEKRDEREEKDEHRHYVERSYGSFTRSFRLPADASDDVKANFRDGVLTVEVAKREEKKPRVVSIDAP